jgi:shikimate kinase/3-dehydroquinate synthase
VAQARGLRPALVFIGFMGAGKSTAAREAGLALGAPVHDSDTLLEQRFGMSIERYFDLNGEPAFRAEEERLIVDLLEHADGAVLALGGGAVTSEKVRAALRPHTAVLVEVTPETAWSRASGRGRPLARDRGAFLRLYRERQALYESVADAFLPDAGRAVVRAALPALRALPADARLLWATAASGDYPVLVGPGAWPRFDGRTFVLSDVNVHQRYGDRVASGDGGAFVIEAGEESKTLATAERAWTALVDGGYTRADTVVGLGGGVVGDLAGFVAATYQRGMDVVHVPTTVVAQVDSAYGGKTGVDLPAAKNYVGAYHQPRSVHVDPTVLDSLPEAERASGYAEVVKTALIAGGTLWDRVAAGAPIDGDVVLACARLKLSVVAADERDGGRRQVLNLGHTVGHALETLTGYTRVRHGEAVGIGLLAALRLSEQDALRDQVRDLLIAAGLPVEIDGVDPDAVVALTRRDKKRLSGDVPFVLCARPGDVTPGHRIEAAALDAAVREVIHP